jgi:hypothetical protein
VTRALKAGAARRRKAVRSARPAAPAASRTVFPAASSAASLSSAFFLPRCATVCHSEELTHHSVV